MLYFFAIKMKNIINFCYQNIMFIMFLNDMNIINCYVKTCLIPVILRTHEMYYICFTCMWNSNSQENRGYQWRNYGQKMAKCLLHNYLCEYNVFI